MPDVVNSRKQSFPDTKDNFTYELSDCDSIERSGQIQARKTSSMDPAWTQHGPNMDPAWNIEGRQEITALAEEQSAYDSCWERKYQFSLMMLSLWGNHTARQTPCPRVVREQNRCDRWEIKKKKKTQIWI